MARAKNHTNGRLEESMRKLEEAHATLALAQATLVQNLAQAQANYLTHKAEIDRRTADYERDTLELKRVSDARFARIEATLAELIRLLEKLPEAVREKIGFKAQQ
jgi:hypothetical protein